MERPDVIIIGAGIAAASAAYEIAAERRVLLLEREAQPGYHSTGRSAAVFTEIYGNAAIRALTVASGAFFAAPPAGFSDYPLLKRRPMMMIGREDQRPEIEALYREASLLAPSIRILDRAETLAQAPMLRPDYAVASVVEPNSCDMDVHAIHAGFLRGARQRGAQLISNAEVRALTRTGGGWRVETSAGAFQATTVINAAGAWADEIAAMTGVPPIGLVPKRRTAFTFTTEPASAVEGWPTVIDVSEQFYFKPEAGKLLGSPADETPVPPGDVQPEELDVAIAIDRIGNAADFTVRTVERRWAGLRSFVADKTPVVGFDGQAPGFFWLAAQGGYGIQTSPALGRVAAALVAGKEFPADLTLLGLNAALLSPGRLRNDNNRRIKTATNR